MKSYTDYVPFQTDDFLLDADFKRWVASPSPEATAYWQGLLRTHPHLKKPFDQARYIALGLEASQVAFSASYKQRLFEQIEVQLSVTTDAPHPERRLNWWLVAASVAVLLLATWWGYDYYLVPRTYQTHYAQTQQVTLYDGTIVRLNANSRLEVPNRLNWRDQRSVRLAGEAYFVVAKQLDPTQQHYRKFTVQTSTAAIEVYGTQFNVYARHQQTKVLLDEGKVRIIDKAQKHTLELRPGQLVEVSPRQKDLKVVSTRQEEAQLLTSWTNNLLVFNDAPLDELARRFQEVYGLELILKGEAFTDQQFQGELPINNLEEALVILSTTFEQKAIRDGNRIYFVPNE
jgi:transmembrane sensor